MRAQRAGVDRQDGRSVADPAREADPVDGAPRRGGALEIVGGGRAFRDRFGAVEALEDVQNPGGLGIGRGAALPLLPRSPQRRNEPRPQFLRRDDVVERADRLGAGDAVNGVELPREL